MTVVSNMLSHSDSQKGQHNTGYPSRLSAGQFRYINPFLGKKEVQLRSTYRFTYTGEKVLFNSW